MEILDKTPGGRRDKSTFLNYGKLSRVSLFSLNTHSILSVLIMVLGYPQLNCKALINFNICTLTFTRSYVIWEAV